MQSLARRQKLERWLVSGIGYVSSSATHYIREYLHDQQGGKCALCGLDGTWQGVPISLVLDHIDGNAENNHRENLRLLCPNCDSQLPTYKSRNRGNGRAWRRQRYADGKSY